jgi:hypothetical protein
MDKTTLIQGKLTQLLKGSYIAAENGEG